MAAVRGRKIAAYASGDDYNLGIRPHPMEKEDVMKTAPAWNVLPPFLIFGILTSGCAVGNKYAYHDMVANIGATGTKTVSMATHDRRPYVVDGEKRPDFTGTQRGGFGNPFDVSTETGKALAEDMTAVMSASLAKNGFKTVPVTTLHSENPAAVMEKLKKSGGDLSLLLKIDEWISDTYTNVGLRYDATLSVFDKDCSLIAEKRIKGEDNLGGSAWNPPAHARKAVPEAFVKKIEELFNAPEISKAFR